MSVELSARDRAERNVQEQAQAMVAAGRVVPAVRLLDAFLAAHDGDWGLWLYHAGLCGRLGLTAQAVAAYRACARQLEGDELHARAREAMLAAARLDPTDASLAEDVERLSAAPGTNPVLPERSRGAPRREVTGRSSTPLGQSGATPLGQSGATPLGQSAAPGTNPVHPERSRGAFRHEVTGRSSTPLGQSGATPLGQNGGASAGAEPIRPSPIPPHTVEARGRPSPASPRPSPSVDLRPRAGPDPFSLLAEAPLTLRPSASRRPPPARKPPPDPKKVKTSVVRRQARERSVTDPHLAIFDILDADKAARGA